MCQSGWREGCWRQDSLAKISSQASTWMWYMVQISWVTLRPPWSSLIQRTPAWPALSQFSRARGSFLSQRFCTCFSLFRENTHAYSACLMPGHLCTLWPWSPECLAQVIIMYLFLSRAVLSKMIATNHKAVEPLDCGSSELRLAVIKDLINNI